MRECGKYIKMRDFPHNCGMVDTYDVECLAIMNHVFHVMLAFTTPRQMGRRCFLLLNISSKYKLILL